MNGCVRSMRVKVREVFPNSLCRVTWDEKISLDGFDGYPY